MNTDNNKTRLFYDGSCGLCHYFVRFSISRMSHQTPIFFSPLKGKTFKKIQKKLSCHAFPDSIVVYDEKEDQFYLKSKAIIKILISLRYPWKLGAFLIKSVPIQLADVIYDFVVKIRHRLFKKQKNACPFIHQDWGKFFED